MISNINEAEKKGYVFLNRDKSEITYPAQKRTYDFHNPKEKTRLELYFNLLEKYRYPMAVIEFDAERNGQQADIVIFTDASKKKVYLIIDCFAKADLAEEIKKVAVKASAMGASFASVAAGHCCQTVKVGRSGTTVIDDIPTAYGG